jgi:hypothetical protein
MTRMLARGACVLSLLGAAACEDQGADAAAVEDSSEAARVERNSGRFVSQTRLLGEDEVPPVQTEARGVAIIRGSLDGESLHFRLLVARIDDVVAAHIHCGEEGENGAVGVTLFSGGPVTVTGLLDTGTVLEPDANNLCGWEDVGDVLDAINDGDAYVNVHTLDVASGEIRGQL